MLGHPNPKPPSVLGGENSTIGRDEIPGFRLWLPLRRSFSSFPVGYLRRKSLRMVEVLSFQEISHHHPIQFPPPPLTHGQWENCKACGVKRGETQPGR